MTNGKQKERLSISNEIPPGTEKNHASKTIDKPGGQARRAWCDSGMERTPKAMKTNEKKKLSPLEAADMPTGAYRAGFRIKAQIPPIMPDYQ